MGHNDSINFYNKHHPDIGDAKDSDLIVHLANESSEHSEIINITKKAWEELINRVHDLEAQINVLSHQYNKPRYIVHRTLRTENKEVYVSFDRSGYGLGNYSTPFEWYELFGNRDKSRAAIFDSDVTAILIRDHLNEKRQGKRYLWVISEVAEVTKCGC